MFYHLLYPLHEVFSGFNVFRYSTFRSIYAALTAIGLSLLIGPSLIRYLRSRTPQPIRSDGPKSHLSKSQTPTMGGLLIVSAILGGTLLWARWDSLATWMVVGSTVWFAGLGAWDDWLKLSKKNPKGLPARYKLLGQTMGAVAIVGGLAFMAQPDRFMFGGIPLTLSHVKIPLLKAPWQMGWAYYVLAVLVIVGASNAVNLTDGLDGLAIGVFVFCAMALAVTVYLVTHAKFSEYLGVIYVRETSELVVYCAVLIGAGLGFLWFNAYPAEVFMGDMGSLALGAALGTVAVLVKQEFLLVLIGGMFVLEAFSVIIQVGSYRLRKQRVFLMAPIHHHFELMGLSEPKIVVRFWICTIVIVLGSLSFLKLR